MDIPVPKDSGTSGTQLSDEGKVTVIPEQPIGEFTQTMQGLANLHPGKLGGQIGSQILTAMVFKLEKEVKEKNDEVAALRSSLDIAREQLNGWKTKANVLGVRLISARSIRLGGSLLITVGITVFGVAVNLLEKDAVPKSYGSILAVAGLISTITGWVMGWQRGSGGEDDS